MLDLDALEAAWKASTPGEWSSTNYGQYAGWSVWAPGAGCIAERWYATGTEDVIPRNDLFIALAHNALPALIAELRELRAYRDAVEHAKPAVQALLDSGEAAAARVRELEGAARYRPISEAHEDDGPIVLINIDDPGDIVLSHICNSGWEDEAEGKTHFVPVPWLSHEEVERLRLPLPAGPEGEA